MYSTIIDSLCKDNRIDYALTFLSEMVEKRVFPNVITSNTLIYGLCGLGRWEDAKKMIMEMDSKKINPDVHY